MPQNVDDYETDGKKNMCSTHKRIGNVVRCMLLLLFSSRSENGQIIVATKALYIFIDYNLVPAKF
jgi:hypothetical protein